MKQIISKVSRIVIPSKAMEKSKNNIAELAFKLVKKEIKKLEIMFIPVSNNGIHHVWFQF